MSLADEYRRQLAWRSWDEILSAPCRRSPTCAPCPTSRLPRFAHEPVSHATRTLLDDYARDSPAAGRYDFAMGRRLPGELERAGFRIESSFTVEDRELSFQGPAAPGVIDAWRSRFCIAVTTPAPEGAS